MAMPMYCWEAANSFEICSLRAAAKSLSAMRGTLPFPAEAGFRRLRLQGACRMARLRAVGVVAGRRHVVGRVGMEDRGQVLDVAAAGTQLPLAAAVGADVAVVAVVVRREQLAQRTEARRLDVDHLGWPGPVLDVGHAVDRGVPGDAIGDRVQDRLGLV